MNCEIERGKTSEKKFHFKIRMEIKLPEKIILEMKLMQFQIF